MKMPTKLAEYLQEQIDEGKAFDALKKVLNNGGKI